MKNSSQFTKEILSSSQQEEIMPCDDFSPYLVQKYLSGVSPEHCSLVNSVFNTKLSLWRDSQDIYDFMKCVIPKNKSARYRYFGAKNTKEESSIDAERIANSLEMSKKELLELVDYFPDLLKTMTEDNGKTLKAKN